MPASDEGQPNGAVCTDAIVLLGPASTLAPLTNAFATQVGRVIVLVLALHLAPRRKNRSRNVSSRACGMSARP
jgi:hypothetical protein